MRLTNDKNFTVEDRAKELQSGGHPTVMLDLGYCYKGLYSDVGTHYVAYIELPENHPDIEKDYNDLHPGVNGGLTYHEGRVYGWDYAHAWNKKLNDICRIGIDIENARRYFRKRETRARRRK